MSNLRSVEIGIISSGIMGEALMVAISKAGIAANSIANKLSEWVVELQKKHSCSMSSPSEIALHAKNVLLIMKPQDMNSLLE